MRLNPTEHPIMLAEPSHNTKEVREKTVELMFEKYGTPGKACCSVELFVLNAIESREK